MKKILVLILGIVLCTGCSYTDHIDGGMRKIGLAPANLELHDVTFNGETHEYVLFYNPISGEIGSMTHWEGCKYCEDDCR